MLGLSIVVALFEWFLILSREIEESGWGTALCVRAALARQTLCGGYARDTSLDIMTSGRSLWRVEGSKALEAIERHKENWGARIPTDEDAAWTWFQAQDRDKLRDCWLSVRRLWSMPFIRRTGRVANALSRANCWRPLSGWT